MSDAEEAAEAEAVVRVLLVGGAAASAQRTIELLDRAVGARFEASYSERLTLGLDRPDGKEVHLVVLDLGDARQEAVARLQDARRQVPDLPIVLVSDVEDEVQSLRLLRSGASASLLRSDLSTRNLATSLIGALENHRVIENLKAAREREHHLITHDHLTGLANRVLFNERLSQLVARARVDEEKLAVLVMDLDHFGVINETLGHAVADSLLRSVAGHLADSLDAGDMAARLGADEFAILLPGLGDEFEAAGVAGEVLGALCKPIPLRSRSIIATGSIGIAAFPRDAESPEQLVQRAHSAMEYAKRRGGNRYEFYTSDMNAVAMRRTALEDRLRAAVDEHALVLHYQPQFDLRRERVVGAEALLRWNHPELGLLGPESFLDVAEESGLIISLGKWVMRTACLQAAAWHGMGHSGLRISVNVSPTQFRERDFTSSVCAALEESGLPPECLEIEITESSLVQDAEGTVNALHALKELGVHLAIDDFGTGYSALAYLKHLPIDVLKIDQTFIRTLTTDPADRTIVESVALMARGLNLTTVAEGVETREQLLLLGSFGCNRMQGYLFGKPMTADEFGIRLQNPHFQWGEIENDE